MSAPQPMPARHNDDESENDDRGGVEIDNAEGGRLASSMESAASQTKRLLLIAAGAGLAYGVSLRDAPYPDQAAAKVLMCALLFLACARHEPMSERLRLMAALAASAVGDALLALPPDVVVHRRARRIPPCASGLLRGARAAGGAR